jgi:nucleoside-diphosphate-sugar epimerase
VQHAPVLQFFYKIHPLLLGGKFNRRRRSNVDFTSNTPDYICAMHFVTGGTGMVGAHLLLKLTQTGACVQAVRRKNASLQAITSLFHYHNASALLTNIEWLEGDINDTDFLSSAIQKDTTVYHCAALVSFAPKMRKSLLHNNITGTSNVVNACLQNGAARLAYISSTAAIGRQVAQPVDEQCLWSPEADNSDYSLSKYYAEQEVWRGREEGLKVVIVNPAIIIGPGAWGKSSTGMFATAARGLKFYTAGSNGFVDVRDVVDVLFLLLEKEIYDKRFLVVGENMPFKTYFALAAKSLGLPPPTIATPKYLGLMVATANDIFRLLGLPVGSLTRRAVLSAYEHQSYDNSAVCKALGFSFRSAAEALQYTAEVYKSTQGIQT